MRQKLSKYDKAKLEKNFVPSKTAVNSLKFITKDFEKKVLATKQAIEVINVFKLILLILGETIDNINDDQIIPTVFSQIIPKYKSDNLKNLLTNQIAKKENLCANDYICQEYENIKKNFPNICAKKNMPIAYINFIVKEYFDCNAIKFEDGSYLHNAKKVVKDIEVKQNYLEKCKRSLELYKETAK